MGVGDIMMGTSYPEDKLPGEDWRFPDARSGLGAAGCGSHLWQPGRYACWTKEAHAKTCKDPKVCYVFRTPTRYVKHLITAGFDMMSLANNHAGDFGEAGRKSSMKTLEVAGILHAGQMDHPTTLFTKDSITYALAAFAPNSNCVSLNDLAGAKAIVAHLDSIADVVIVSFHGGAEGAQYQNVPRRNEIFHGENRGDVYKFSRTLIDAGADIVFGHGPHVTRAVDVYHDRFIAYSLGNFCTYRGISVSGVNGMAPIVKVFTDRKGKFFKAQITPTVQIVWQRSDDRS